MFSLWVENCKVPDSVRENRSILLPKSESEEELRHIKNRRPLTIGNHLYRLYTRILTALLTKAITLNPRQRGFMKAPGCNENIYLLHEIMRDSKESGLD